MTTKKDYLDRFTLITIVVQTKIEGRGMTRKEIDKMCRKLEKTAKGRSSRKIVSAIC